MVRLFVALLVAGCALVLFAPAAQAADVPVTVSILRFVEVQDPDPVAVVDAINSPDVIGDGDYYAEVRIGDNPPQRNRSAFIEAEDVQPRPPWSFTRSVDDAEQEVPVVIRIWDADEFENNDDIMDINPQDNVQELVLSLDLMTCTWTGDVDSPQMSSAGDGDHEHFGALEGGEAGKILFAIGCSANGDIDGDGIPDAVERFGIRDIDGNLAMDLQALPDVDNDGVLERADPCRANILVEIDFLFDPFTHTHRPSDTAIAEAIAAFDGAGLLVDTLSPDSCPYADEGFPLELGGIGLIPMRDDMILEESTTTPCTEMEAIRADNFDPALAPYVHYNLWVHTHNGGGSSGQSCPDSGKDFIVSLGRWSGPDTSIPPNPNNGTDRQQSGTFMHELGHNLGFTHGGGVRIDANAGGDAATRNCKPNYLSVMNYLFQTTGLTNADTGVTAIDYSRSALPTLDEARLDEADGIGDGALMTIWADPTGNLAPPARGDGRIDWNGVFPPTESNVAVDLTNVAGIGGCGQDGDGNPTPTPGDQLRGWEDWGNLKFQAVMAPGAGDLPDQEFEELTPEDAAIIENAWQDALTCFPPDAGEWIVAEDCTIYRNVTAPGDLTVESGVVLQVGMGITLDIDFASHALRVEPGAKLLVRPGGRIE